MKKFLILCAGLFAVPMAVAENLQGVDEMICAAGQAQICLETGSCYATPPWELNMPEFVVIDTKAKTVSTTKASGLNRATEFTAMEQSGGLLYLQGIEGGRPFSFVINEVTGHMTAAVSRDGLTVTVFGSCTDTDI